MEREGGFIVLHRRIESWPLWKFLRADQRHVVTTLLLMASWKDSQVWSLRGPITVKRGQVLASEQTIAERAGTTRQVVRTVFGLLEREGFAKREPAFSNLPANPATARTPHLITITNYDRFQSVNDDGGEWANQPPNHTLTQSQPRPNPEPTPLEQVEQEEQKKPPTPSSWDRVVGVWNSVCVPAGFAKTKKTAAQVRLVAARMKDPEWFDCFERACRYAAANEFYRGGKDGNGWVATFGWFLKPGKSESTAERSGTKRAATEKNNGQNPDLARAIAENDRWLRGEDCLPLLDLGGAGDGQGISAAIREAEDPLDEDGASLPAAIGAPLVRRRSAG